MIHEPQFVCRNGLIATEQGKPNRFGHKPYFVTEKRRVQDSDGTWHWRDVDTTIYIDPSGRCVLGGGNEYDHKLIAKFEDVERDELKKRRSKDNWI
jgi:hypothetical protein